MISALKTNLALAALIYCTGAPAASSAKSKPDLADIAQGNYFGAVISDARGASHSDVHLTVVKIGPNRVRVTADYPRLPAFAASLTRAMDTIQKSGPGNEVFLLDLSNSPPSLDITVDDASWSGRKQ